MQTPQQRHGTRDAHSALRQQCRKVFIGGVPQSVDEEELRRMFSEYGKIDKAWLQRYHNDELPGHPPSNHRNSHRGFGFILFHDKLAVEQLLAGDFSKVLMFGDNMKLEVKRAVAKSGVECEQCPKPKKVGITGFAACPDAYLQNSAPTSWSMHTWLYPTVPPQPQFVTLVPIPGELATSNVVLDTSCQYSDLVCKRKYLTDFLLDGFAGRKPLNSQDLNEALLEAMPDHYDE
jgi:hypothetical protein